MYSLVLFIGKLVFLFLLIDFDLVLSLNFEQKYLIQLNSYIKDTCYSVDALSHQLKLQLILFHRSFPPFLGLLALQMIGGLQYLVLEILLQNPVTDE